MQVAFRDMILASEFRSSEHFVSKDHLKKFFAVTINDAEQAYASELSDFQKHLDQTLTPDHLDKFDDLERPRLLRRMQVKMTGDAAYWKAVATEKAQKLADFEEKERKRKAFIRKQKTAKRTKPSSSDQKRRF
ncbi:MAG: hypothetical protein Q7T26_04550 [Dehalococcoidia bacterium]|nr:hypothetical protein [Dehalococcoidia bacterium]